MRIYLTVYKRLLWLILTNLCLELVSAFKNLSIYLLQSVANTFLKLKGLWCRCKSILFGWKLPQAKPIKRIGFVIHTRCPILDRVQQRHDYSSDSRLGQFLKHLPLLERVLVEVVANAVAEFNQNCDSIGDFAIRSQLFLLYRKTYTGAYHFDSWLDRIPDHLLTHHPVVVDDDDRSSTQPVNDYNNNNSKNKTNKNNKNSKNNNIKQGLDHTDLLEVGLHAALLADCDFVIVLNPRAIGIDSNILRSALNVLMNDGCGQPNINVVLGHTKNSDPPVSNQGRTNQLLLAPSTHESNLDSQGLYLVGLRGGRSLTLGAKNLCRGVEWSSSTTGSNLWLNLQRYLPKWNVCSLLERLEEIAKPEDLPLVENYVGLKCKHILDDSITLIIPIGPGHPDDDFVVDEDVELVDFHRSKSLTASLDLAVYNASGQRPIEIIIINSNSSGNSNSGSMTLDDSLRSPTLDKLCSAQLRPMIKVKKCFYDYGLDSDGNPCTTCKYPKRGELIRFAVERYAHGSILLFMEPGILLPQNWDTAVYLNLQNPKVGMGSFAFRLNLPHKYIYRKSIWWSIAAMLANFWVNKQTLYSGLPIVGQPCFIYAHYLKCIGGYPESSRWLHTIDLAMLVQRMLGSVQITKYDTSSACVPIEFALKHGAYRSAVYNMLLTGARLTGASESELNYAKLKFHQTNLSNHPLPLLQPYYLDGY